MERKRRSSAAALALHLRPIAARLLIIFFLTAALALVFISKTHPSSFERLRMGISDTMSPVIHVLASPTDAITRAGKWVNELSALRQENEALKIENTQLKQWQTAGLELQSENEKLRKLLQFAPPGKSAYTSARIVADTGNPFARSAIITSGSDQGVAEDLAVINDNGLVGRVVEVGKKTSRILLLTDLNSRIPVISEHSRERAIAGGNGGDLLTLFYQPAESKLAVGERIITSGDGGVLPPGLPVGIVTKIEKGTAVIKPFVDWYHLEYVSIVDFSM